MWPQNLLIWSIWKGKSARDEKAGRAGIALSMKPARIYGMSQQILASIGCCCSLWPQEVRAFGKSEMSDENILLVILLAIFSFYLRCDCWFWFPLFGYELKNTIWNNYQISMKEKRKALRKKPINVEEEYVQWAKWTLVVVDTKHAFQWRKLYRFCIWLSLWGNWMSSN